MTLTWTEETNALQAKVISVYSRKRQTLQQKQDYYWQVLTCTTYDLCCHKHKDMMHAENCPIARAERELTTAEISAIESGDESVLAAYRAASKLKANDRKFWLGIPVWMR